MTSTPPTLTPPPADSSVVDSSAGIRQTVIWVSLVVIVAVLLWGGLTAAAELTSKQVQKEYLAATDAASRAAFAKRHARHPLGGLVILGQAHSYYNGGDFAAALGAYTQAQASLKTQPILAQQALLGEAFSQYNLDNQKGLAALKKIVMDTTLLDVTRAHAATELAGYAALAQNWTEAKQYIQLVDSLPNARPWQRQTANLKEIYPQLGS